MQRRRVSARRPCSQGRHLLGGGVSEPDEERGLRAADAHARFRARTCARRGEARSRRGRSPRRTSSLPREAEQLLRLSTEGQESGARPSPGGKVAVFRVVKRWPAPDYKCPLDWPNRKLLYYQPIKRKYLSDYATQRVLRWLLEGGAQLTSVNGNV